MMETKIFIQALHVGNRKLVFIYDSQMYEQKRGLAMGVADSPDLANLYGWHFEKALNIHNHPLIPFYGRYIDDVCAIVYASSENEARTIINTVQFDDCIIEWNVSDQYQVFLDMTLYVDENRKLQHMPYRKALSHQERIPWISHHPLDVKRGTFIGEMSRLATISSTYSVYCDAISGLAALYIARGYPSDLVHYWVKNNIKERWEKRLNITKPQHDAVLVLKSEFNTAWNYFSASELGNTILGYWRDWIQRAETGDYSIEFPEFSQTRGDLEDTDESLATLVKDSQGQGHKFTVPDIRKLDILNRRMLVSRKRTRNLFDLTNLWKNIVLLKMDQQILMDNHDDNTNNDHESDMDIESDDHDISLSSDRSVSPFVQLLRNQGATF
jgi:hypothetical protein